jgi:hypothetical protein
MAESKEGAGREGVSLQTLLLAALSSGAAAIIVSQFWENGTVFAAAMTPVLVSLLKEALAKPMESEIVKRPVQRIASGSRAAVTRTTSRTERVRSPQSATAEQAPPSHADSNGASADGDDPRLTPVKTYGKPPRRSLHVKVALVTGLLAFVIAAAALTIPELLFGGSVTSSGGKTTLFGGGKPDSDRQKDKDADKAKDGDSKSDSPDQTQPEDSQSSPSAPDEDGAAPPADEEPAPSEEEPEPAPAEPAPAPAPSSPVPNAPAPPSP